MRSEDGIKLDAWMPLYIGDWDGDTRDLNCEEDGAYGRLVRYYWRMGAPPDNDQRLANIIGMEVKKWKKLRPSLERFFIVGDGLWRHKKVDSLLAEWSEKKRKFIERASSGGKAKAEKSLLKAHDKQATSTRQAGHKHCTSASSPTVEPIKGSTRRGREKPLLPSDRQAAIAPLFLVKTLPSEPSPSDRMINRQEKAAEMREWAAALKSKPKRKPS